MSKDKVTTYRLRREGMTELWDVQFPRFSEAAAVANQKARECDCTVTVVEVTTEYTDLLDYTA